MPRWDPVTWNDEDVVVARLAIRFVRRLGPIESVRLARELLEEAASQRETPVKKPDPDA